MSRAGVKIILLLFAVIAASAVFGAGPEKNVLLIYSFGETAGMPFAVPFRRLLNESPYQCNFTVLELRHQDGTLMPDWQKTLEPMLPDIENGKFDAIVTVGDQAYRLISDCAAKLPVGTPLIFAQLMVFDGIPKQHRNTTGNMIYLAPGATVELAQRIFPERKNVVLVTNNTWAGLLAERRMKVFMKNYPELTLTTLRGEEISGAEAVQAIRQLEDHGILLYFGWFDKDTQQITVLEDLLNQTSIKSTIPIFKLLDMNAPQYGVIGGVVGGSQADAGVDTAHRLIQVFDGQSAESIPVFEFPARAVVNYEMLKAVGADEDNFPRNTVFLGKKESFWTTYQREIIAVMAVTIGILFFSALAMVLFLLGRQSALRTAQVLKRLPVRFVVADEKGEILHCCMGEDEELFFGNGHQLRVLDDFDDPQLVQLMREKIREVLATGARLLVNFQNEGAHRFAVVSALPVSLFHRKVAVWISQDITVLMKTQAELDRSRLELLDALARAQEANKAKSYFLATMSHEIRTPLNAVIGFSELLQNDDLPRTEKSEYLAAINLAGNSLLNLINDVLDLSKLEAEQMVISPRPTNVMELLEEIQAVFQYKIRQKRLFWRLDCPADMPVLKLDNLRLRQILLNLIGNAVKFTERGGVTVSTEFQPFSGKDSGTLILRIRDTGVGVPVEMQDRIFHPFVQSDVMRDTHIHGGTGLGLSISLRLAERMNGRIMLESKAGQGSCFTLVLESVDSTVEETAGRSDAAVSAPSGSSGLRVLLVDDVQMNLKVLQAMLRKIGAGSVCAASGDEALELLRKDPDYSLVLTDLWMPGMDGAELARRIHANPATAGLPVVVVTADAQMPEDAARMFRGVLLKPVTQDALQKIFLL